MSKHLFIILPFVLFFILACSEDRSSRQQNLDPGHTSKNSLSWEGIYSGISPCADCSGILNEIELRQNSTYTIARKYLGEDDSVFRESGSFKWNDAGNRIMLYGDDQQSFQKQFLVGENRLIQLTSEGKRIQTSFPEAYIFDKASARYHPKEVLWQLIKPKDFISAHYPLPQDPHIILSPHSKQLTGNTGCRYITGLFTLTKDNGFNVSGLNPHFSQVFLMYFTYLLKLII